MSKNAKQVGDFGASNDIAAVRSSARTAAKGDRFDRLGVSSGVETGAHSNSRVDVCSRGQSEGSRPLRIVGPNRHIRGFRVTDRDLAMVRWVGRLRFAEAAQVGRRFGLDERHTYRRLRGLIRAGLLDHRRVFHNQPGAYWATRAGLDATGLRLPPAGIDIRTYEHDRLAAVAAIVLEDEFGPDAIVTERELRSLDAAAQTPSYAVARGGQAQLGRSGLHFPDLAVDGRDGRPLAVEVELTAKGRGRLDSIVAGYVRARHIAGVRYYAAPAARAGLERAIARTGAGQLFAIHDAKELHP